MPGPASTEGDRPPTNPAIRVCFPSEADGIFFRAVAVTNAQHRSIRNILFSEKSEKRHLLENEKQTLHSLSDTKRNVAYKLVL